MAVLPRWRRWSAAFCVAPLVVASAHAQTQAVQDIVLALPAVSLTFSMGYVADDLGIYARHGLRVKTVEIAGVGAINAVISGSADFAQPSAISLTRAAAHGQRLLAIAETLDRPVIQLALRKDLAEAGGFDPADPLAKRGLLLRGRTIAVDAVNSLIHAYVRLIAHRAQYDPEEIHIAVLQPPSMIAAFDTKQIDGFAMSPPWALKPVLEGTAVMLASGPDGDPPDLVPLASNVLVTKPETCEKRPTLCEAMGHALVEASAYMHDHPSEVLAVLRKRFPTLSDELLTKASETIRKITPMPPVVTREGLENSEIFNIDAGLMQKTEKLHSYDGLYTDKYVR